MSPMTSPLVAFHPANTLTYASVVAGLSALLSALAGHAAGAGAFVALAVVFDTFDGSFARRFSRTPVQYEMGVQLDSLADATAFGAVPVVCVWVLADLQWVSASAGLLYGVCAITRLAFYNVTHENHDGFVGLPVPVAALIWSTTLILDPGGPVISVLLAVSACAMVMPFYLPRPRGIALAAFACWPFAVVLAHSIRML